MLLLLFSLDISYSFIVFYFCFKFISNSVLSKYEFEYSCYVIKKLSKNIQNSFKKNNTPYTCKQPLIMPYEGYESARDNFGKFIYQFQPETKTLIRKLEKILITLSR